MITIKDLINTSANTVKIDWIKVEQTIGFPLYYDLKNFYSRILCEEQKVISGNFNLVEDKFIQKTGNVRFDTWFSFNECEGELSYELFPIKVLDNACKEIEAATG